jgi:hypothetical protein
LRFVRFIPIIFLLTGCLNEADCLITGTNQVKIAFKNASNAARVITFNSITVSGLSTPIIQNAAVSSVQLPVDPELSEVVFTFNFEDRVETMRLTYKTRAEVISPDCGVLLNYGNLEVADTSFETYSVVTNQLLINAPVNVEIRID